MSLVAGKRDNPRRFGGRADRRTDFKQKDEWVSAPELNSDPLVGGSVSAIRKTLQRLENRGVVEDGYLPQGGKSTKLYCFESVRAGVKRNGTGPCKAR